MVSLWSLEMNNDKTNKAFPRWAELLLSFFLGLTVAILPWLYQNKSVLIDVSSVPLRYWGYMTDTKMQTYNTPLVVYNDRCFVVDSIITNEGISTVSYVHDIELLNYYPIDISKHSFTKTEIHDNDINCLYLYSEVLPDSHQNKVWRIDTEKYLTGEGMHFVANPPVTLYAKPKEAYHEHIMVYLPKAGYYKIQINTVIRRDDNRGKTKKQVFELVSVEDVNMLPLE